MDLYSLFVSLFFAKHRLDTIDIEARDDGTKEIFYELSWRINNAYTHIEDFLKKYNEVNGNISINYKNPYSNLPKSYKYVLEQFPSYQEWQKKMESDKERERSEELLKYLQEFCSKSQHMKNKI